ncbi:MAG TPA: type II secretion system protein [Candidatus Wallbacteria bacterium]|nr:type II secretion system protein [Candidatus Wallbacteria bacterium]
MMKIKSKNSILKSGVSIIELLITMLIISILVGFASTYYSDMQMDAREKKAKKDLEAIKNALVAFVSDENNVRHERPDKLSELEYKEFKVFDPGVSAGVKYIRDISEIKFPGTGEIKPDDSSCVYLVKRSFIEKMPRSPFGNQYWADLYYVYTLNPFNQKISREPYISPTSDTFVTGKLSDKFYQVIPPAPNVYCSIKTGEVTLATHDATNKNANDAVILSNLKPFNIKVSQSKKVLIEFSFNYKQRQVDDSILNTMETRILESATTGNYAPSSCGMAFVFKSLPVIGAESQILAKSGIGFKFSASAWELYDSPDGAKLRKLMTGGWSEGNHTVKFAFFASNMAECYLDGDGKGTAQLGADGDVNSVYFALSPDMFNTMSFPPAPYPPAPVFMDSEMNIHQIIFSGVDFSTCYDKKINSF